MRLIIFLSILILFTGNIFANPESLTCSSSEKVSSYVDNATKNIVISCNCNCTNEENKFYFINSETKKITSSYEASRLVSFNGITNEEFNQLNKDSKICPSTEFDSSYESGLVFAFKVPTGSNGDTCFDIKSSNSLDKVSVDFKLLPSYLLKKEGLYKPNKELKLNLNQLGLYRLSNNNINNSEMIEVPKNSHLLGLKLDDKEKITTVLFFGNEVNYIINVPNLLLQRELKNNYKVINSKTYLFRNNTNNKKTKMYLIKGDKVTLLDEKTDDSGQKWYFINYKGKKDLNMWIKAEAIDIPHIDESKKKEDSVEKESQTKEIKNPVLKNTATVMEKNTPESAALIEDEKPSKNKATFSNEKESAGGSLPLSLFVSLISLFTIKLNYKNCKKMAVLF